MVFFFPVTSRDNQFKCGVNTLSKLTLFVSLCVPFTIISLDRDHPAIFFYELGIRMVYVEKGAFSAYCELDVRILFLGECPTGPILIRPLVLPFISVKSRDCDKMPIFLTVFADNIIVRIRIETKPISILLCILSIFFTFFDQFLCDIDEDWQHVDKLWVVNIFLLAIESDFIIEK